MWKRFALAAVLIAGDQRRRPPHGRAEQGQLARRRGVPEDQPDQARPKAWSHRPTAAARRRSWSSAPTGAHSPRTRFDRTDPPHSDTILLVRFDPEQGQTSVMSIPRDLMVNIKTPKGAYYPSEKINAAYTIGSKLGGVAAAWCSRPKRSRKRSSRDWCSTASSTSTSRASSSVVDTLGCVYVNVDHRYFNQRRLRRKPYSEINLQPGLPEALLRKRAQLRALPPRRLGLRARRAPAGLPARRCASRSPPRTCWSSRHVAKAVGHAIASTGISSSAETLIELAKLVGFSQGKPLRQVKFQATSVNATLKGGSYVLSTTEALEHATLDDFLNGDEKLADPQAPPRAAKVPAPAHGRQPRRLRRRSASTPRADRARRNSSKRRSTCRCGCSTRRCRPARRRSSRPRLRRSRPRQGTAPRLRGRVEPEHARRLLRPSRAPTGSTRR